LISFQNIFSEDYEDGSIELLLASRQNLSLIVLIKIFVNWIFSCLPIIILSVSSVFLLYFPQEGLKSLIISLLIGTHHLSFWSASWSTFTWKKQYHWTCLDVAFKFACLDTRYSGD